MKDFLKSLLIDPFTEDWIGVLLGSIMWILTILIFVGISWLSIWMVDSFYLPVKQKEGIIVNKYYTPAHTNTTFVMSGKVMIPVSTFIDECYMVNINIDGLVDDFELDINHWNTIKISDKVNCNYSNGRILESLYIKSFNKL